MAKLIIKIHSLHSFFLVWIQFQNFNGSPSMGHYIQMEQEIFTVFGHKLTLSQKRCKLRP